MLRGKNSHSPKVVLRTTSRIVESVSYCRKEGRGNSYAEILVIVVVTAINRPSVSLRRLVLAEVSVISYFGNFLRISITTKLFV